MCYDDFDTDGLIDNSNTTKIETLQWLLTHGRHHLSLIDNSNTTKIETGMCVRVNRLLYCLIDNSNTTKIETAWCVHGIYSSVMV